MQWRGECSKHYNVLPMDDALKSVYGIVPAYENDIP